MCQILGQTKEKIVLILHKFFMKTSMFKKFFIFSVVFLFSIAFVAFMFFLEGKNVSNDNIDISIFGNNFTAGGEDLPILIVEITNKNNSALDLVDLIVEYPKGSVGDLSCGTERLRMSLGTIPSGSSSNENLKVVLFGEQGSVRPVQIFLLNIVFLVLMLSL